MTHFPEIDTLPDAIFWDWDGTIVDSYQFLNDAHNHTLRTLGLEELKEGEFRNYFGKGRDAIFASFYGDQIKAGVEIFQKYVMENNHKIQPIEGVREVLSFLYERRIKMGVVTNKVRRYVGKELQNTGLYQYLPIVICASEASRDKPFPDPLLLAIEKAALNVKEHEIWYAGDTETDLLCAKGSGCRSAFLEGHRDTKRLLSEYAPYISFDNYSHFKDFLVAI